MAEIADLVLVVVAIALVAKVVLAMMSLAVRALLLAAAYFAVPAPLPPSLSRISTIIEQRQAEQPAIVAARQSREPPPEIVAALRATTAPGRR